MHLIVARHAESRKNVLGVHNGDLTHNIFPLTRTGRVQAQDTAALIKNHEVVQKNPIRYVFVSPFLRTLQTAEIIATHVGLDITHETQRIDLDFEFGLSLNLAKKNFIVDHRLQERSYGSLELTGGSKEKDEAELRELGIESNPQIRTRVLSFLASEEFQRAVRRKTVLVVTHLGPAKDIVKLATRNESAVKKIQFAGHYVLPISSSHLCEWKAMAMDSTYYQ